MEHLMQTQNIYILIQNTSVTTGISVGKCYCIKSALDNELQLLPNTDGRKYTTAPCQKKKNKMKPLDLPISCIYRKYKRQRTILHNTMGIQSANSRL